MEHLASWRARTEIPPAATFYSPSGVAPDGVAGLRPRFFAVLDAVLVCVASSSLTSSSSTITRLRGPTTIISYHANLDNLPYPLWIPVSARVSSSVLFVSSRNCSYCPLHSPIDDCYSPRPRHRRHPANHRRSNASSTNRDPIADPAIITLSLFPRRNFHCRFVCLH